MKVFIVKNATSNNLLFIIATPMDTLIISNTFMPHHSKVTPLPFFSGLYRFHCTACVLKRSTAYFIHNEEWNIHTYFDIDIHVWVTFLLRDLGNKACHNLCPNSKWIFEVWCATDSKWSPSLEKNEYLTMMDFPRHYLRRHEGEASGIPGYVFPKFARIHSSNLWSLQFWGGFFFHNKLGWRLKQTCDGWTSEARPWERLKDVLNCKNYPKECWGSCTWMGVRYII